MSETLRNCLEYAYDKRPRFVAELKEFVRYPSVSAQPRHARDVRRCAAWLAKHLQRVGLEGVRVASTPRHPVVVADWKHATGRPTVLIYGHYDVQPADPVEEWETPPFEPVVRGDALYGRGSSDDKGQLFVHVKALESYLHTAGRLPVNVVCLFEGEEEIGSPNLPSFIDRHRDVVAADVGVVSDMRILAPDRPALTYSLRGALGLELEVAGPEADLHSGTFGGAIHNPAQALSEIIAQLHDGHGRVAIPGFYDRVRRWSEEERAFMQREYGEGDATLLQDARAKLGWGERRFSLYERTTIRPALVITGISSGYQGPGSKSIIPARAKAGINIRLVPDQDPYEIERLFRRYVEEITPPTVRAVVRTGLVANPAYIDRRHPVMRAAAAAYRHGFGVSPVRLRSGGTIPVVDMLQRNLSVPTALMGFALPDDRLHAPNEKFHLPTFYNGISTSLAFLEEIAARQGARPPGRRRRPTSTSRHQDHGAGP
jgi:acetylornithine deacetylase/succinyl-diaminopimelate desuccinylase-like protein